MFIPTITFSDDAIESAIAIMHALVDYTVDLDIPENTGYPAERVSIVRIDSDGDVVVAETDETGVVLTNATWAVPINLIRKVVIL